MARPVSIEQLRTDVADQCDVAVGSTGRYSATLINRFLNKSIQRFRERLSTEGITHYLVSKSGTLSSGTTSPYPFQVLDMSGFDPGVVRTFGVDITCNGVVRSLEHRPFQERATFGSTTDTGVPLAWAHFRTEQIAIFPAPDAGYSYTVWYLPTYDDLENGDTFDGVAGWEDYLVQDVVCRLISRDQYQQAYQQANLQREQIWADILRAATKVSAAGGAVRGRDTFGAFGVGVGGRRGFAVGGTGLGDQSVTNAKLAQMAAETIKANVTSVPASPQDATPAQIAAILPKFSGTTPGLVPTGASNPALFLSQAGSWLAPTVGGSVSGLALSQLSDISSPVVLGRFGAGTGPVQQMSGAQVASMIPWATTTRAGLVPVPSGGAQGFALKDDLTWGAVAGAGGGGPTMLAAGPAGAVQYNGGSGFAGASGLRYDAASGLTHSVGNVSLPTGAISFGFTGVPGSDQGLILAPHGQNIIAARSPGGNNAGILSYGGASGARENVIRLGGNVVIGNEFRAAAGGDHRFIVNNSLRSWNDDDQIGAAPGVRLGLQQLAFPTGHGDRLAAWTGSGFANIATGIHVLASGMGLGFGALPAVGGDLGHSNNNVIMRAMLADGSNSAQLLKFDSLDRFVRGDQRTRATYEQVVASGWFSFLHGVTQNAYLDREQLHLNAGLRLGLSQLAVPDSVGDKLGAWTASGFATIATGINVTASGTRISVGSGGPQIHASGIDMRSSDVRNVRRINGLYGIKPYGDLPDADSNVTAPSGTVFIIPLSVTQGRAYALVPSGAEHGDSALIENYSAFSHSIHNTGTGLGAASGWIATLAPSGGLSARFASGAWEFVAKYKFGGF